VIAISPMQLFPGPPKVDRLDICHSVGETLLVEVRTQRCERQPFRFLIEYSHSTRSRVARYLSD
jgi:hypothetical protein